MNDLKVELLSETVEEAPEPIEEAAEAIEKPLFTVDEAPWDWHQFYVLPRLAAVLGLRLSVALVLAVVVADVVCVALIREDTSVTMRSFMLWLPFFVVPEVCIAHAQAGRVHKAARDAEQQQQRVLGKKLRVFFEAFHLLCMCMFAGTLASFAYQASLQPTATLAAATAVVGLGAAVGVVAFALPATYYFLEMQRLKLQLDGLLPRVRAASTLPDFCGGVDAASLLCHTRARALFSSVLYFGVVSSIGEVFSAYILLFRAGRLGPYVGICWVSVLTCPLTLAMVCVHPVRVNWCLRQFRFECLRPNALALSDLDQLQVAAWLTGHPPMLSFWGLVVDLGFMVRVLGTLVSTVVVIGLKSLFDL